jgi:diguanylate cyclase (GGDEF)-like protein
MPITNDPIRLNAELDRRLFELEALLKAGEALQGELDVGVLCNLLMTMVRERVRVGKEAVLLHDEAAGLVAVEATHGLPEEASDLSFPAEQGILWSLLRSGEPFSVLDLAGDPRFPDIFAEAGLEQLEGQLWIPLSMPSGVVGVLSVGVGRDDAPVPTEEHVFLHRLANRAALAIHTAMLYRSIQIARKDLDRSLHQLSLLFDVTRALSAVSNLTKLLRLILERAIEAVSAEKGSLYLYDDTTDELGIRVIFGLPDKEIERKINDGEITPRRWKPGEGTLGKVFQTGQAIRVDREVKDESFKQEEGSRTPESLLCVPLTTTDSEVIGVINISNRTEGKDFANEDQEILGALAQQAAVAIARARLYEAAITDGMTGLFIRRFAMHKLNEEVKRSRRYGNALGVVMCDIDHFKRVNDTWGHPAGDEVIIGVANTLQAGLRIDVDAAGRYGGEEFLLIMPQTDAAGTGVAADRLRAAIEALQVEIGDGRTLKVTMSFGVTELGPQDTAESVIARADQALYVSKDSGRNMVTVFAHDHVVEEPAEG